jgi:hypothetical protein
MMKEITDSGTWATLTQPPSDILKLLILEYRYRFMEASHLYIMEKARGGRPQLYLMQGKMYCLVKSVLAAVRAQKKAGRLPEELRLLWKLQSFDEMDAGFDKLDDWLYEKGLLKFDNRGGYDPTDTELENKMHGM